LQLSSGHFKPQKHGKKIVPYSDIEFFQWIGDKSRIYFLSFYYRLAYDILILKVPHKVSKQQNIHLNIRITRGDKPPVLLFYEKAKADIVEACFVY
jgi:hypothetical protein